MIKLDNMKNSAVFISEIEKMVDGGYENYIDAIVFYCQKTGMDVETAASLLKNSAKIKSKIQKEAEKLNLLPKTNDLGV